MPQYCSNCFILSKKSYFEAVIMLLLQNLCLKLMLFEVDFSPSNFTDFSIDFFKIGKMDKSCLKIISQALFPFLVVKKEQNHYENYILPKKIINFSQFFITFSPGIFQNFPRGTGSQKFDFPRGSPPRGSPGLTTSFDALSLYMDAPEKIC